MVSRLLRVQSAHMIWMSMPSWSIRAEPSIKRNWAPPTWGETKPPGLPVGSLKDDCRLWTTEAVIGGRQFWQPESAGLYCLGGESKLYSTAWPGTKPAQALRTKP